VSCRYGLALATPPAAEAGGEEASNAAAEAQVEGGGADGADGAPARRHLSAHQQKLLKKVFLGAFAFAKCFVHVMTCDNRCLAWKCSAQLRQDDARAPLIVRCHTQAAPARNSLVAVH